MWSGEVLRHGLQGPGGRQSQSGVSGRSQGETLLRSGEAHSQDLQEGGSLPHSLTPSLRLILSIDNVGLRRQTKIPLTSTSALTNPVKDPGPIVPKGGG